MAKLPDDGVIGMLPVLPEPIGRTRIFDGGFRVGIRLESPGMHVPALIVGPSTLEGCSDKWLQPALNESGTAMDEYNLTGKLGIYFIRRPKFSSRSTSIVNNAVFTNVKIKKQVMIN